MKQIRYFQALVALSWMLYATWSFLPNYWSATDPGAVRLLSFDGHGAILSPQTRLLTICVFWLWLLAAIGAFFFQNWGRYLFLGLSLWSIIGAALFGVRVTSPLDSVVGLLIDLLDGAILALMYLSPIRDLFGKTNPESTKPNNIRGHDKVG